ncbi:MAG: hypothetical protein EOO50_15690 [Flavobacterium sp.]|uniref:putative glycolipid-binding domain-containing protein n=1 Tax=Flavobacterium sp. TaxID=239 RepID=UPI001207D9DC|nr:putative glycolipid-binding domain-containing protein [Flavobacterium sp.]RZJ64398.1 MAG: hypothetical protein EOO50_15690 [Flavobacterium sp.]
MTREFSIRWKGPERDSKENCRVCRYEFGFQVFSQIQIGARTFQYMIECEENWNTENFAFRFADADLASQKYTRHSDGTWTSDGKRIYELDGCIDIDISLTPLTNSLPIKRLQLKVGESVEINVVYIDPENNKIFPAAQRYTRLDDLKYRFETIPNDFEAVILVDENGFVEEYPNLFERF